MTHRLTILFILFSQLVFARSEIRIAVSTQPDSLFYPISVDNVSELITSLVVESLIRLDPKNNEPLPLLAQKWQIEKNRIRFEIDSKARFSDGTSLTALDVIRTFEAFKNKKIPSPEFDSQFNGVKEVALSKNNSVQFTFDSPSLDHLRRFSSLPILSQTSIQDIAKEKNFATQLAGSGPYKIEAVISGNHITLAKNPQYWNEKNAQSQHLYKLKKITLKIIPDPNTQLEMLKNGGIDYMHVLSSKSWNTDLKGEPFQSGEIIKSETTSKLPYQVIGIVWNTRLPIFQGIKTRTALAHLYPVQKFIKNFFFDSYLPSSGIFHPYSECHSPNNTPKEFSKDLALKLLKEDGWVKNADGHLYKNGKPFKFNLIVRQPASLRHLTVYQEELKQAGIEMTLQSMDWVMAVNKVRNYDFEASEYSMDRPALLSELEGVWGSKGALNYSGLIDPEVDSLISRIQTELKTNQRINLCKKLDERVSQLQPLAFGWEQVYLRLLYRNRFDTGSTAVFAYSTWRDAFHHWEEKAELP